MSKTFILVFAIVFSSGVSYSQETDSSMAWYIKITTVEKYIVVAGTSRDHDYLESQAKKISKKTGLEYDNQGMVYDPKRGMIAPDSSSDELYAGSYFPRRGDDDQISIEMLWYYQDNTTWNASPDMVIIAGIFEDKEIAKKQLEKIKTVVPTAYIKKKGIYMGCMH